MTLTDALFLHQPWLITQSAYAAMVAMVLVSVISNRSRLDFCFRLAGKTFAVKEYIARKLDSYLP